MKDTFLECQSLEERLDIRVAQSMLAVNIHPSWSRPGTKRKETWDEAWVRHQDICMINEGRTLGWSFDYFKQETTIETMIFESEQDFVRRSSVARGDDNLPKTVIVGRYASLLHASAFIHDSTA